MLTEQEKNQVANARENQQELPDELKLKLSKAIESGEYETKADNVCCKYRIGNDILYGFVSTDDCKNIFGGDVVSDSYCKK